MALVAVQGQDYSGTMQCQVKTKSNFRRNNVDKVIFPKLYKIRLSIRKPFSVRMRVRLHLWWLGDLWLPWARLCMCSWIHTVERPGKKPYLWKPCWFYSFLVCPLIVLFWVDSYSESVPWTLVLVQRECHQSALEVKYFQFLKHFSNTKKV